MLLIVRSGVVVTDITTLKKISTETTVIAAMATRPSADMKVETPIDGETSHAGKMIMTAEDALAPAAPESRVQKTETKMGEGT
jgi:hypothetical protein